MKLRSLIGMVVCCVVLGGSVAHAQDETLNRAREAFDKGQALYEQEKFDEAAEQFATAYEARPFPAFLYNAGASFAKARNYEKAIEYFEKYLVENPNADDKADVQKRIEVYKKEIERINTTPPPTPEGDAGVAEPPPTEPSAEVQALGEVKIRGLVVIESKPQGAYIYLDDKKGEPMGRTPWNGTLDGEHTVFIESQGYKPEEKPISAVKDKVVILYFSLAEEDYLGWIDIRANVPGANIYIDDKVAVFRRTPYSGNIKPGKHKIWVTKEGYDEFFTEVEIVPGETHEVKATLTGGEVGYLNVRGRDVEKVRVYVDGKKVCTGPCKHGLAEGSHKISIARSGYKTYTKRINIKSKTEVTLRPNLAKQPSRADAVWAYIFAAAFTGGGIYLGLESNKLRDEIQDDINKGNPPPDEDDPRFFRGKILAGSADAAYALGAITGLAAVYYTFRDKGRPSTATMDVSSIAIEPEIEVRPGYAGIGLEVRW